MYAYRYCTCTGTVHMYRYIYEYCAVLCYQNFNYLKWRAITAVQVIRGDRKTPEVIQSVPVQYCVNFNPPPCVNVLILMTVHAVQLVPQRKVDLANSYVINCPSGLL